VRVPSQGTILLRQTVYFSTWDSGTQRVTQTLHFSSRTSILQVWTVIVSDRISQTRRQQVTGQHSCTMQGHHTLRITQLDGGHWQQQPLEPNEPM
jgi:hypothetical protein